MVGINATKWLAIQPVTSRIAKTAPNSRFALAGAERGLGSRPVDPSGEIMDFIPPHSRDQTRPQRLESYSRPDGICNAFSSKFRPRSAATDADAARRAESRLYDAHVATSGDAATYTPAPGKPALLLGALDIATVGYVAEEFFKIG